MYSMVILDDEKIVLQGIQKLCQKEDFGFVIKGAFVDSLKALDALPGLRPHLIITDVRMPQMDGLECCTGCMNVWRQKSDRQPIIRCWMDMPEDLWEKRK